jgi:hypothetical protein
MRTVPHAEVINAVSIGVMAERVRQLGPDKSGLYNFYVSRLEAGKALIHYDLLLGAWCLANVSRSTIIVDIGAGLGQFSALMAANGFTTIACENDGGRFEALQALHYALGRLNPTWGDRLETTNRAYPFTIEGLVGRESLAICSCLVATVTPEVERQMAAGLRQFTSALIDPHRFGRKKRDTPEELLETMALLKAEGLSEPEPVLKWDNGHFHRVRPA